MEFFKKITQTAYRVACDNFASLKPARLVFFSGTGDAPSYDQQEYESRKRELMDHQEGFENAADFGEESLAVQKTFEELNELLDNFWEEQEGGKSAKDFSEREQRAYDTIQEIRLTTLLRQIDERLKIKEQAVERSYTRRTEIQKLNDLSTSHDIDIAVLSTEEQSEANSAINEAIRIAKEFIENNTYPTAAEALSKAKEQIYAEGGYAHGANEATKTQINTVLDSYISQLRAHTAEPSPQTADSGSARTSTLDTSAPARTTERADLSDKYEILPPSKVKGRTLREIASDYNMSEEDFIQLNRRLNNNDSSKFEVVGKTKTRGSYCRAGDTVYAPKRTEAPTPPPPPTEYEQAIDSKREQYQQESDASHATAIGNQGEALASVLANPEALADRAVPLPEFLQWRNRQNFTGLFENASQQQGSQTQEVIRIIQREFGWDALKFREILRRGLADEDGAEQLTFKDLTREVFNQNPKQFFERYQEISLIIATAEAEIAQVEREVNEILDGMPAPASDYKQKGNESLDSWEDRIVKLGANTPAGKAAMRAILTITDIESRMSEAGSFEEAQTIQDLASLKAEKAKMEDFMVDSERLLDALDAMTEGEALVVAESSERTPSDPTEELLYSAFEEIDRQATPTYADRRGPAYKKSGLLSRRLDPEEAMRRVLDQHSHFDTDQRKTVVDWEGVRDSLQTYLEEGVINYFMDPNLDIIEELEKAGSHLEKGEKQKIEELQSTIITLAEAIEKNNRIIKDYEEFTGSNENRRERLREKAEWAEDENTGPGGYEEQLLAAKNKLSKNLEPHLSKLLASLNLPPVDASTRTLTEQQQRFIQNGYIIHETLGSALDAEQKKTDVLKNFSNNPVVYTALRQIIEADTENQLTYDDLLKAGRDIEQAANGSLTMREITPPNGEMTSEYLDQLYEELTADIPAEQRPTKDVVFGLIGLAETSRTGSGPTRLESAVVGGFVAVPIKNSEGKTLFTISVGAQAGFDREEGLVAGVGAGASKNIPLVQGKLSWTTSLHAGASLREVAVAKSETITWNISDNVSVSGGGSLGLRFNPAEGCYTLGAGYHAALRWAPTMREVIERHANRGSAEALSDMARNQEAFQQVLNTITELTRSTDGQLVEETQDAMLDAIAEFYEQEMRAHGETEAPSFYVAGISVVSVGGLPIPMLMFSVRGKTRAFPIRPNDHALMEASNIDIQRALADTEFSEAEVCEQMINGGAGILETPDFITLESGLRVKPESSFQSTISHADIAQRSLDSYNKNSLLPNGMELTPGTGATEGLLNLHLYDVQGEVQIVPDPSMEASLILGPSGKPDDIYLAIDQLHGDLTITKQVISYPRKSHDGGYHRKTIITIKENPSPDRNYNTFFEEEYAAMGAQTDEEANHDVGYLTFAENSTNVIVRGNDFNTFTWEEFQAHKEELRAKGVFGSVEAYQAEYEAGLQRLREATRPSGDLMPNAIREAELAGMAPDVMRRIGVKKIMKYLTDGNLGELSTKIQKEFPAVHGDYEANYLVTVLLQTSYVEVPEENKQEFADAHKAFFLNVLENQFGSRELAEQLLTAIDFDNLDLSKRMELPLNSRCFTVVGRAGVIGMREDVLSGGAILGAVDLTETNPELAQQIMASMKALDLPTETTEFLSSPEALTVYANYSFIKGPEEALKLQKIYESDDPSALLTQTEYQEVFEDFQNFVERLHNAGPGTVIVETNSEGKQFMYVLNKQVIAGIRERCANPSIGVTADLLVAPLTMRAAAGDLEYGKGDYSVFTPAQEFFAGGMYQHHEYTTPPETPPQTPPQTPPEFTPTPKPFEGGGGDEGTGADTGDGTGGDQNATDNPMGQ